MGKYIFCIALLLLLSCGKSGEPVPPEPPIGGKEPPIFLRNFIVNYGVGPYYLRCGEAMMGIHFDSNGLYWVQSPDLPADPEQPSELLTEYRRLSERNGDTSYNRESYWILYMHNSCYSDNFRSMHVVCKNRAIDAFHPAGSSIDDLIMVHAISCADYIRNNYTGEEWTLIHKLVSELQENELTMINPSIGLYFAYRIKLNVTYEIEVTLVTTEGETHVITGYFKPRSEPPWRILTASQVAV